MSRKKEKVAKLSGNSYAERQLQNMKFKDLKRANVARGLSFEEASSFDILQHQSWFLRHEDNTQNIRLIDEYDDWVSEQMKLAGYPPDDPVHHPSLRLGFVAERDSETGEVTQTKKPRMKGVAKEKKKKAERLEGTNVMAGTKKAYTYQLTMEMSKKRPGEPKYKIERIIEKVMEAFPDAKPGSIKIWHKKCLREKGKK